MAYDPTTKRVILFGGSDMEENCFDDTWAYDPAANTWTELTTAAPPARVLGALACDRASGRLILFGGYDGKRRDHFADTWAFGP